jgi:flavorubredoxin
MKDTKVLEVTKDLKWIGVLDRDIVTFDVVMETLYGTTYNSYYINADKKTIVETTKLKFWDTYLQKIKQVCDPDELEYIILDHTEPDHSGNLENLLKLAPQATVVGSGNAIRYLKDMFSIDFKSIQVKDGDTLSLGNKTLRFFNAPNLHWPDSIYTYLEEDKVLFTCDSFGAHYCTEEMFDDLVDNYDDSFKYYFDVILKPFSKFFLKSIEKIKPLEIDVICTGHGPILRSNWKKYVELSEKWSREAIENPMKNRVFVAYVSAYQNTGVLANSISAGLKDAGDIEVVVMDIEKIPAAVLDEQLSKASGVILGSPTINQNILPQIYNVFALMSPIRDKGKLGAAFGSYGWSGEGAKFIETNLSNLKLKLFEENLFIKFTPANDERAKAYEFGFKFGEALKNNQCGGASKD